MSFLFYIFVAFTGSAAVTFIMLLYLAGILSLLPTILLCALVVILVSYPLFTRFRKSDKRSAK